MNIPSRDNRICVFVYIELDLTLILVVLLNIPAQNIRFSFEGFFPVAAMSRFFAAALFFSFWSGILRYVSQRAPLFLTA